jgi:hypothetical protein
VAFLCVSQKGELKNTIKKFLGKINFQNFWPKNFLSPPPPPLSSLPSAFVRFSTRGVQKHHKTLFGGSTCQKILAEKVEGKKNSFVFSHRFFFIAFLAVSLHEEPQNTIKIFSQIRPENLKKSQKT